MGSSEKPQELAEACCLREENRRDEAQAAAQGQDSPVGPARAKCGGKCSPGDKGREDEEAASEGGHGHPGERHPSQKERRLGREPNRPGAGRQRYCDDERQ